MEPLPETASVTLLPRQVPTVRVREDGWPNAAGMAEVRLPRVTRGRGRDMGRGQTGEKRSTDKVTRQSGWRKAGLGGMG